MKKAIMIFALATGIGVNGFSQQNVGVGGVNNVTAVSTSPAGISLLQTQGKLITQNFYNTPTGTQITGNFTTDARWNSMGSLNAGSQVLNGFRTQTNGRALTLGYSTLGVTLANPTGTNTNLPTNNPTIQWIGNATGASVTPGNLEFKYALNPTAPNSDVPIFTMAPQNATGTIPAFNYAEAFAFIGQKESGTFGSFGVGDIWSATGQIKVPTPVNLTSYGARQQFRGFTVNNGLLRDNNTGIISGVLDYGVNQPAGLSNNTSFKFRVFTNPNDPSTVKNVWQTNVADGNVMMGRQDISAVNANQFYLSVYDGAPITASPIPLPDNLPVQRAGIYSTSSTITDLGVQLLSYASVVGDLRFATPGASFQKYAILGLAEQTIPKNNWAGYFVGNVGYTGNLVQVSDKKFKTSIADETSMVEKLMQLQPKNYFFDREKYKNMAFNDKLQHGFISQEVEKIFPELVEDAEAPVTDKNAKTNTTAYKGINYTAFIPMLIKAIQEQELKIEKLETQIAASKNTFVLTDKTNLPAEIENKAFTLSQNTPNPFSEKTTISYTIPSNVKKATLAVFDLTGKMLLQYNLQAGKNTVAINGSTLPAGMYLYSLLADGQEVLSKRMVLTK